MKVLIQAQIGGQDYSVAQISPHAHRLWGQFWTERTNIWTAKYGEKVAVDGRERDRYDCDRQASYVVLVRGTPAFGEVVAGTRLIHADSRYGTKLPLEEFAGHVIDDRAVEVSRFFFERGGASEAEAEQQFKLFLFGIVTFLKQEKYERAYATIREALFYRLKALGIPMERLSQVPEGEHAKRKFIPAVLFESPDLAGSVAPSTTHAVAA